MEQEPDTSTKRRVPNILITGTPGSGKTTVCQLLNTSLGFKYLPIGQMVNQHKLYSSWNKQFNVPQFDEDMVLDYIEEHYNIAGGGLIFEFHSSDFFPLRYFDLVVLVRCDSDVLYKRLEARGYDQKKIRENVDCQIFQVIKEEVATSYPPQIILQLNNSKENDMQLCVNRVIEWLQEYSQANKQQ